MGTVNNLEHYDFSKAAKFDVERLAEPDLGLRIDPSFRIEPSDRVFVMGSCFAEEIRLALGSRGFNVTDAGLGNKYNTFSMMQTVAWALDGGYGRDLVVQLDDGLWFDGHRYPFDRHERSQQAVSIHQRALNQAAEIIPACDVIVLTLGLVEVWRDNTTNTWLNGTPPRCLLRSFPGRFAVAQTTHAQNLDALLNLFRRLIGANPSVRIVCSVSPVPLMATFFGPDVIVSNMYSKSTLRSVVAEAVQLEARRGTTSIDYFPSYEMVMLRPREEVWREKNPIGQADGRHVRREFVDDVIVRVFVERYLGASSKVQATCDSRQTV